MRTFIIAEVGQAHDGSLGILHSYIDALAHTGVDAVKFQTHIAMAESSEYEPFRVKFSYEDKRRFDYWKRMEFTFEQWKEIKQHCDEVKLEFLSSPFSLLAVDLLEKLGVEKFKIGSGEITNYLMLEKIAKTGKDIILSSGMSSLRELSETLNFLKSFKNKISLLQCTTAYPTSPSQWGLNVLSELRETFGIPVGFSDHSGSIYAGLAATTLGAEIIEVHSVFDKRMFGPDSKSSLTIEEISDLVQGIRQINESLRNPINKNDVSKFSDLKSMFEKSLAVNKKLSQGHCITFDDLEAKKPKGYGIDASLFQKVIGKKLLKNMEPWEFLTVSHLESWGD